MKEGVYLLTQQIFIEHLLGAGTCFGCWKDKFSALKELVKKTAAKAGKDCDRNINHAFGSSNITKEIFLPLKILFVTMLRI